MKAHFDVDATGWLVLVSPSQYEIEYHLTLREQLKISIEKWRAIVRYLEETGNNYLRTGGQTTCALCIAYNKGNAGGCDGCPIQAKTGHDFCRGTPYELIDLEGLSLRRAYEELEFLVELGKEYGIDEEA